MARITLSILATLALFVLPGCGGKDDDTGASGDSDGPVSDGESPEVTEPDAYCYEHTTGDTFFQWVVTAVVIDPQGPSTLETFATVEIWRGGGLYEDTDAVIDGNSGNLTTSFNADTLGVPCSSAEEFTFKIIATDDDGNTGEAEVVGRQGTG
ncbi:MAG: hypothetical protein H6741_32040 [Alphaproteobacteria bacterium]|nr:hypothetical protein [Alphaproteobacteria bacterium]